MTNDIIMNNRILRVVGICGSLRDDSWNLKLLNLALNTLKSHGHEVEIFDLSCVPLFNSGKQKNQGFPRTVSELRAKVENSDLLLIASPEYNNSMSATIKNVIEWLSLSPNLLEGKACSIMGCSPGRSGGMRMHTHLTYSLQSEGVFVIPTPRVLLPNIETLISDSGEIIHQDLGILLEEAMKQAVSISKKLAK